MYLLAQLPICNQSLNPIATSLILPHPWPLAGPLFTREGNGSEEEEEEKNQHPTFEC